MQEPVGYVLVWSGLVLFFAQVGLTVVGVLKPKKELFADEEQPNFFEKAIAALADKFPVAALGVAAIWVGSNILGWWPSAG